MVWERCPGQTGSQSHGQEAEHREMLPHMVKIASFSQGVGLAPCMVRLLASQRGGAGSLYGKIATFSQGVGLAPCMVR